MITTTKANATDTVTEVLNNLSTAEVMVKKAREMGSKEGTETSRAIKAICDAKETWSGGPFVLYSAWLNDYTEEQLASFPRPGVDTGNNPNAFKIEKTSADGKTRTANTTFYAQYAEATKEGREIRESLGHIETMLTEKADKSKVPQPWCDMNEDRLRSIKDQLSNRIRNMGQAFTKAARVMWQISDVSDMELLSIDICTKDDDDTQLLGDRPFIVYTTPEAGKPVKDQKRYSLGSFLSLKPKVASEKGGTLKALDATLSGTNGGAQTASNEPAIKTLDTWIRAIESIHSFADEMTSDGKQTDLGALAKKLNSKGSDELLATVTDLRNMFNDILSKVHNAGQRYTEYQARGGATGTDG